MTEPSGERPRPGPPRPGPVSDEPSSDDATPATTAASETAAEEPAFDDLPDRPVSEHVAFFEAEHARLQRELGTIDQL